MYFVVSFQASSVATGGNTPLFASRLLLPSPLRPQQTRERVIQSTYIE
jgi:hypothetical protein